MAQQVKILHLIDSLSVGGAERLLVNLARRLDRSRFDLHVCCTGVIYGNAFADELAHLNTRPFVINARRFYDPRTFVAVAHYVRQHDIDVIHTQLTTADIVGRIVGLLTNRPVISTLQNEPTDYNRARADRRWLARVTSRHLTTRLVAVSSRVRQQFINEWHIPPKDIETIYNAVPMEDFSGIPVDSAVVCNQGHPVITNIGRLTAQKAQHLLLEAAKIVLEQCPNARFMIVGQGDLEQPLKAQAQALGIAEQVTFTGVRHDVATVLSETDIFVLASLWEGLPLTAVEAMAAARPVVLSDVGGNRELVQSGMHGMIVPPADVRALADTLVALLRDPKQRLALGQAARNRVQYEFSIDTITAQYEKLYESIVINTRARRNSQVSVKP